MSGADDIQLTKYTRFAGCGAKLGPGLLDKALCGLSQPEYPELIASYETSEDSGIYQISATQALIQTVDFFPPIVDDPFVFGRIAAANALSDIYACGGTPVTAVSIVGFPKDTMEIEHLRRITEGGLDALAESRTALVGGHSIDDRELKFGFSVTGLVNLEDILRNNSAVAGDLLFITKPLGTGTINTAYRAGRAHADAWDSAQNAMSELNRAAAACLKGVPVSACTDVTGFGLIGHICEMIAAQDIGMSIQLDAVPLHPHVSEYIEAGFVPGGTLRNRKFRSSHIDNLEACTEGELNLLFDPQTSGGLLFTIAPTHCGVLEERFRTAGTTLCCIGSVTARAGVVEVIR